MTISIDDSVLVRTYKETPEGVRQRFEALRRIRNIPWARLAKELAMNEGTIRRTVVRGESCNKKTALRLAGWSGLPWQLFMIPVCDESDR